MWWLFVHSTASLPDSVVSTGHYVKQLAVFSRLRAIRAAFLGLAWHISATPRRSRIHAAPTPPCPGLAASHPGAPPSVQRIPPTGCGPSCQAAPALLAAASPLPGAVPGAAAALRRPSAPG